MKKFLSLLLLPVFLVVVGCSSSITQQSDTLSETYTNKTDMFSLQFPDSWTFQENVYNSSVMFFSPQEHENDLRENFGIIKNELERTYTPEEYYTIYHPELAKSITNYIEISKEDIMINNIP